MSTKTLGLLIASLFSLLQTSSPLAQQAKSSDSPDDIQPRTKLTRIIADISLLRQLAETAGVQSETLRLEELHKACNTLHRQMTSHGSTEKKSFAQTLDISRINRQISGLRGKLERKLLPYDPEVSKVTDELNRLLKLLPKNSSTIQSPTPMHIELTLEQIDAILVTDGKNIFSSGTGKLHLPPLKWPILLQRKELQRERNEFETSYTQAASEAAQSGSPTPETTIDLLRQTDRLIEKIESIPVSDSQNARALEIKWRHDAKNFLKKTAKTLENSNLSGVDEQHTYTFHDKTLGQLVNHLKSHNLQFSAPHEQDTNLYASLLLGVRYFILKQEKSAGIASEPDEEKTKPDAKKTADATPPRRWMNTTYNQFFLHVGGKNWREVSPPNKVTLGFTEVARTPQYVELNRNKMIPGQIANNLRIYNDHMEFKNGDKWEWVANGHWEASR